jgi:hypothetical protein
MINFKKVSTFSLCATACALFQLAMAPNASAGPILGSNLSTFAMLGGAGVTVGLVTGQSTVTGSVGGCCNAVSVTGYPANFTDFGGVVYVNPPFTLPTAVETSAQSELGTAITGLSGMTATPEATLNNITLGPGEYSIGATTLTGTLTLDGGGNANALWVFLESSTLTTASSSTVVVQNTGAGAGLYWVMTTSAMLGSNSTFLGNILANQSITVAPNVTDACGRLLTQVASVTLADADTIGTGCSGVLAGSNGLSGGGTLGLVGGVPVVTPAPFAAIPEPGTFFLLVPGLAGLAIWQKKRRSRAGRTSAPAQGLGQEAEGGMDADIPRANENMGGGVPDPDNKPPSVSTSPAQTITLPNKAAATGFRNRTGKLPQIRTATRSLAAREVCRSNGFSTAVPERSRSIPMLARSYTGSQSP